MHGEALHTLVVTPGLVTFSFLDLGTDGEVVPSKKLQSETAAHGLSGGRAVVRDLGAHAPVPISGQFDNA
jgi:hypothetical protein